MNLRGNKKREAMKDILLLIVVDNILPSDWDLDEVLLLAMTKKDGWRGLADDPRVMEVYPRLEAGDAIDASIPMHEEGCMPQAAAL